MFLRTLLVAAALAVAAAPAAQADLSPSIKDAPIVTASELPGPAGTGCLLDDPSSCAPGEEPPVPGGPKGGPPGNGQQSFCDEYKKSLGDMADTVFGKKQLERLGC